MAEEQALVFEGISKYYGRQAALDNISFTVPLRSIFGIIGPNGAGKSTLLKILTGFMKPSAGKIYLNNINMIARSMQTRQSFGYASQKNCFYPELTVKDNLAYFGKLYWLSDSQIRKRSKDLLTMVGLIGHGDVAAKYLSGGMQRKLDIACAIIHAPKVLLLDEPVAGIDSISAKQLWKILHHINKLNTTILISSHNLEDIDEVCEQVIILNDGKIIEKGTPEAIKEKYTKETIINLRTNPPQYDDLLRTLKQYHSPINSYYFKDKNVLLRTPKPEKLVVDVVREAVMEGKEIQDLDIRQPTLTEIFEQIIQEHTNKEVRQGEGYEELKEAVRQAMDDEYKKIKDMLKEKKIPDHLIDKVLEEVTKK